MSGRVDKWGRAVVNVDRPKARWVQTEHGVQVDDASLRVRRSSGIVFAHDVPSAPPPLPSKPEPWQLLPDEIASIDADTQSAYTRRMNGPVGALGRISAHNAREYVQQLDAMDAPFRDVARCRFMDHPSTAATISFCESSFARARSQSAPGDADSRERSERLAGLVTSKTSDATGVERIEIDRIRSRITRLKKAVHNGTHALDADAHVNSGGVRWTRVFVTLSYADVDAWEPRHISAFAKNVRDWFRRTAKVKFRMAWVLELQKRGAVHYHCMIWVPSRLLFPYPDKQGWWNHGTSNLARVAGGIQRPVSYMAKYTSKVNADQCGRVPKGARMHGCNGLDDEGKRWVRWWRSPLFAREALGGAADIRKVKGGYMDKLTGEFHESPWKVTITPGGRVFAWRVIPHQITEGIQ